jgi:thiol-disulfide isomerase/thioredoxin
MLKHMQVLPTDNIHVVTAGQLIGSYVGHTGANTLTAMNAAKGGILFIDEAYGMMPNGSGNFGLNIMQTLLENITHDDFKGKLVVILAGYADQVEEIFSLNAGFQSRFDKVRLEFPEWTGDQAASSLINIIIRGGKTITEEAQVALPRFFNILADLPNWASARDVRETIMVNMEAERSTRSHALSKERREREGGGSDKKTPGGAKRNLPPPIPFELEDVIKTFERVIRTRGGSMDADVGGAVEGGAEDSSRDVKKIASKSVFDREVKKRKLTVVDYFADWCGPCLHVAPFFKEMAKRFTDVNFVKVDGDKHADILKKEGVGSFPTFKFYFDGRDLGGSFSGANTAQLENKIMEFRASIAKQAANKRYEPPSASAGGNGAAAPPQVKVHVKHNVKVKNAGDGSDDESDGDKDDINVWAALEEACNQLGMTLEDMETMLEDEAGFPPQKVLDIIISITGCTDAAKIKRMLTPQRAKVLSKVKLSIKESQRQKTEEEAKIQAALSRIGHCCMGFAWLPLGNGDYQCAGGSHFCSAGEINREMARSK